jgi:methylase of polypeptide subunit release factors
VQALHLAGHAASVIATDLSERAVDCARITFALSGIDVDARVGSLLEPVAGETFDLIVANPPFVISPRATHTYRDGGFPADSLGAQLCRDLPARLNPGGTALLLANWLHVHDESWVDRVEGWVRDTGCDAWIVERERTDPAAYVDMWLSDSAERDDAHHHERLTQWLDHFDALNVDAIGFGWILLHRSDSDPVIHIEDARTAPRQPDGAEVAAAMDRIVASQHMSAAETLTTAWQVSPRTIVQTRNALTTGAPLGDGLTTVELDSDWREPMAISTTLLEVLRSFDGTVTLNDLIDDDESLVEALIGVRQLHLRGVLHSS